MASIKEKIVTQEEKLAMLVAERDQAAQTLMDYNKAKKRDQEELEELGKRVEAARALAAVAERDADLARGVAKAIIDKANAEAEYVTARASKAELLARAVEESVAEKDAYINKKTEALRKLETEINNRMGYIASEVERLAALDKTLTDKQNALDISLVEVEDAKMSMEHLNSVLSLESSRLQGELVKIGDERKALEERSAKLDERAAALEKRANELQVRSLQIEAKFADLDLAKSQAEAAEKRLAPVVKEANTKLKDIELREKAIQGERKALEQERKTVQYKELRVQRLIREKEIDRELAEGKPK